MRKLFLDPIRESTRESDSRFARRFTKQHRASLDQPFSSDEFAKAIGQAALGRSPGPSGLPYELYKANPDLFAEILSNVFNALWDRGELTASMGLGHVRSLFKDSKPGARKSSLKFWRPITL
ncbi:hypothetical protein OIO90_006671, partial [Microbotryomycetes sp. JL221]